MSTLDMTILEKLGSLTREIRTQVASTIKVGQDITEIIDFVEKRIFSEGYLPAFPCTVSVNEMAAHYTVFDEGYVLQKGDVIKVDFGISENGFCTDNAFTVEVEDNKHEKLIKVARDCMEKAVETIDYDVSMGEIGKLVQETAEKEGFNSIHNLSGHQIGQYDLHCGLSVPSYNNENKSKPEDNMEFAIEPFITYGEPRVKNAGGGNILHLMNDKPVRDPIAKKVLKHIQEHFPRLPFSKRWLVNDILKKNVEGKAPFEGFDKRKVSYALRLLKAQNTIYEYEGLATVDGELVAQFEDAVVFSEGKKIVITRIGK